MVEPVRPIALADVEDARERIVGTVLRTPLVKLDLEALGIPSLDEIVERYSARAGVPVADKLDWYFAYNLFRLAGIVQGIKKRVIDGTASHANAAEMARRVPMLAEAAWSFAKRAGA